MTATRTSPMPTRPTAPVADEPTDTATRRAGGTAALVKAATYLVGFVVLGAYLAPAGFGEGTAAEQVRFLVDHQAVLYAWNTALYLVGGLALVVLVLAVHEVLRPAGVLVRRTATALGLIWSGLLLASGMIALVGQRAIVDADATDPGQAASAWIAVHAVQDALGGGIELVGGVWILLVALAGLRTGAMGRGMCRLGIVVGAAGVLTVGIEVAGAVFGLGFIAWFVWAGLSLLRPRHLR